jgi:bacteriorhodopsin
VVTLTIGTACFGVLIGFITYRTLVRTTDKASVSDLATVVGAVGGGAVTAIVRPHTSLFGWYGIGLLAGFIAYGILFCLLNRGTSEFANVMGRGEESRIAKHNGLGGRVADPNAPRRRT